MFWRNPSAAFFNFLLPLLFLGLFGAILSGNNEQLEILVPGIAGMAVMSTTFNALAFNITALRETGILKRVRGTPLPTSAYLAGIAGSAITNTGAADRDHHRLRASAVRARLAAGAGSRWWLFVVLGVICFASLGVALSHAIPNFDAAPAYVNAAFLPMIFISGVFYDENVAPSVISDVAQALPLKHLIDGLQGSIVTGAGRRRPRRRAARARPCGPQSASRWRSAASPGSRAPPRSRRRPGPSSRPARAARRARHRPRRRRARRSGRCAPR